MKKYFFTAIVLFLLVYSYENDLLQNVMNNLQQVKKADELPKVKKTDQEKKADGIQKGKKLLALWGKSRVSEIFDDGDLSWINLPNADLQKITFFNIVLSMEGKSVNLTNANLSGANLAGAEINNLNLTNSNLSGANLTNASIKSSNLTGVDLTGANLTNADLSESHLTGADLTGADLTEVKIGNAIFCNTKAPWGLDNSGCK